MVCGFGCMLVKKMVWVLEMVGGGWGWLGVVGGGWGWLGVVGGGLNEWGWFGCMEMVEVVWVV